MKKLFILGLPLLTVGTAAAAEAPAGFRLEPIAGYDSVRADFDGTGTSKTKMQGLFVGGGVGFDFPMGAAVSLGVDGEVTFATTDKEVATGTFHAGRDIYAGGRMTAAISDNASVYVKAGYTNFRLRFDSPAALPPKLADNNGGIRGALGVQIGSEEGVYYGFELRYSDYSRGVSRRQAGLVLGVRF
jgi:outer membrane immunogenic protein